MAHKVIFSKDVLIRIDAIVFYLEKNWSKTVAKNFLLRFYEKIDTIASNPALGRKSSRYSSIRKILITKHNMLYFEVFNNRIELLQIFDTRQNPAKNKFD
jgi:plasmid stabilization system protein ParE